MSLSPAKAYRGGFTDGQEELVDELQDIFDTWYTPHPEDQSVTCRMIMDLLANKKREIESL